MLNPNPRPLDYCMHVLVPEHHKYMEDSVIPLGMSDIFENQETYERVEESILALVDKLKYKKL